MTNEQAQKIAAIAEEWAEMAITLHESNQRSNALDASATATFRQRLKAKQEATADCSVLLGIELELLDAVMRAENGE